MLDMAKKRGRPRKHETGRKKAGVPSGLPLHVYIAPELVAALEGFIASQVLPTTKTAIVEHALKRFLGENGHWPPKSSPESN